MRSKTAILASAFVVKVRRFIRSHLSRLKRLSTEAVPVKSYTSPEARGCVAAVHLFETGEQGCRLRGFSGIVCTPLDAGPCLVSA